MPFQESAAMTIAALSVILSPHISQPGEGGMT
jgi:hypothetical protein